MTSDRPVRYGLSVRILSAIVTVFMMSGCAASAVEINPAEFVLRGESNAAMAPFDSMMMEYMARHEITGGAIAVTRNGEVVYARGYTHDPTEDDIEVGPESLFRIASISKPITAVAILNLVEEGRIGLDDRAARYVDLQPRPGRTSDPRLQEVTVRHLLEHLGGWDRNISFDPMFRDRIIADQLGVGLPISREQIIQFMNEIELDHDPGTRYAYSNYGYLLLGRIVETVTGMGYERYVRSTILAPLGIEDMRQGHTHPDDRGMNEVFYHDPNRGPTVYSDDGTVFPSPYGAWNIENMDAHGGWLASALDLARFASSFDDPESHPVLSEASIERMFALPEYIEPAEYRTGASYYALGWSVRDYGDGARNTWHGGSLPGTTTLMVRRRDGLGWVVLFNRRAPGGEFDPLVHEAADAVTDWPDGGS